MTPLDKGEALVDELVDHYGGADGREVGAAAKQLMVAISRLQASDPNRSTKDATLKA